MTYCPKQYAVEYHKRNKPIRKLKARDWWAKSGRNLHLIRKYGITLDQYGAMLEKQEGVCAVCKQPETTKDKNLAVDHDHITGRVRGLLCLTCNRTLIGNRPLALLESAVAYLKG